MENRTGTEQELPQYMKLLLECGFRDGEVKGFHEGEVKGFHDGEVKGEVKKLRENIFRGAERRGLVLTDEQQERIRACSDLVTLDRWFDNVFDAKTADELFR